MLAKSKKLPGLIKTLWLSPLLFLFAACGSTTPVNSDNGTEIPGIIVVSERAYRSGGKMKGAECNPENLTNAAMLDWDEVVSGMVRELLDSINKGETGGDSFDWNTSLGAAGTLTGDPLGFIRNNSVFLVYKVTFDEDSGVALVEVGIHKGNPYDPNSQPVFTASGTAIIGETADFDNEDPVQITSPCTAIYFAARDVARQLIDMMFLDKIPNGETPSAPSTG